MQQIDRTVHLSYKDILLVPYDDDFCAIKSRNDPNVSTEIAPGKRINTPMISAPMDSITGTAMAVAMNKCGATGILTRQVNAHNEHAIQHECVRRVADCHVPWTCAAVGIKDSDDVYRRVAGLCHIGLQVVCLDVANGNHVFMRDALKKIQPLKQKFNLSIIAGNVATGKAAKRLAEHGADTVKVGIGPGAICTTRRVLGFGVPQFSAILDVAEALRGMNVKIIADGGIRNSGDCCKALWAGADAIMSGFIFAGCDECPSFDEQNNPTFGGKKVYRGMASRTVSGRSDVASEGVCMDVPDKGPVANVVKEYTAAIRAACSMSNAANLEEFRRNVRAIRVSTISNEESDTTTVE